MVVDPRLMLICCHICQIALPPAHLSGHLDNSHQGLKVNSKVLDEIVKNLAIPPTLPASIYGSKDLEAYKGLSIQDGFICDSCDFVCGSKDWIKQHHYKHHPLIPLPTHWFPCKMQQLNKAGQKQLWRVATPRVIPDIHEEVIQRMREEMMQVIDVEQTPQDMRMVSPWLMTTKWHEHVAGHDVAALRKLVEIPQDMPRLKEAVQRYFEKALDLLSNTDELILMRLNSPNPVKE